MKTATLIFAGALLALAAFDYFYLVRPSYDFARRGADHPTARAYAGRVARFVDATGGATADRTERLPHFNAVDVAPGIRLIHDPTLGSSAIIGGPAGGVAALTTKVTTSRLDLDFEHSVALADHVTVRVNLTAGGRRYLRVSLKNGRQARALPAEFVTDGALETTLLRLNQPGPGPVTVVADDLIVSSRDSTLGGLNGRVARLEYLLLREDAARPVATGLTAGDIRYTVVGK